MDKLIDSSLGRIRASALSYVYVMCVMCKYMCFVCADLARVCVCMCVQCISVHVYNYTRLCAPVCAILVLFCWCIK